MDLVAKCQAGDVEAFETLYRQHSAKIYTLASRMAGSAEDGEDLQKKLNKVNKQIEENAKDQADQKSEIEKQRQALETIKGKRRQ